MVAMTVEYWDVGSSAAVSQPLVMFCMTRRTLRGAVMTFAACALVQVESTMAMQVLQPRIKDVQTKYKNDQEKMQLEVARIYKEANVNPLAGCLPTLATLPVWIGLYRWGQGLIPASNVYFLVLLYSILVSEGQS